MAYMRRNDGCGEKLLFFMKTPVWWNSRYVSTGKRQPRPPILTHHFRHYPPGHGEDSDAGGSGPGSLPRDEHVSALTTDHGKLHWDELPVTDDDPGAAAAIGTAAAASIGAIVSSIDGSGAQMAVRRRRRVDATLDPTSDAGKSSVLLVLPVSAARGDVSGRSLPRPTVVGAACGATAGTVPLSVPPGDRGS